jgi:membrane-associated protease RseP (regulator of RpoE activity)
MKKTGVCGVCLVIAVVFALAAIGHAQQATTQPAAPFDPAAPAATAQPGQAATQPQPAQPAQPGIETRQDVMSPANRFGQQRGFNLQTGIPDQPTAAELQAQQPSADAATTRQGQAGDQGTTGAGRPGELGVWLVASGGPGVQVRRVTEGSAAAQAGLQPGDVLLQVNGQSTTSPQAVSQMISECRPGRA